MNVILYTTGCPRCLYLEQLLNKNHISYKKEDNKNKMVSLGFTEVPILEVDGVRLDYKKAEEWIVSIE